MSEKNFAIDLSVEALRVFAATGQSTFQQRTCDSGPAVLAALSCADCDDSGLYDLASTAVSVWLDWFYQVPMSSGLFGGLAGMYVGAHAVSSFMPEFRSLSNQLRDTLANEALVKRLHSTAVGWEDYDLISGPSGTILALRSDCECSAKSLAPAARHLVSLCGGADLSRLRLSGYREDTLRGWNCGRINTGLAHGVGGVISALRAAYEVNHSVFEEVEAPLKHLSHWLMNQSFIDKRGLQTWHIAGLDGEHRPAGANRRQAWCYGTPGLAWTLWEAGRVLDDADLLAFAEHAMQTFCAVFDENFYIDDGPLDDALSICHGVAGTLAIADAFALHAEHKPAVKLADYLDDYLQTRADEILQLAHTNMTLLTGASGILAVMQVRSGRQRGWLSQIGLF